MPLTHSPSQQLAQTDEEKLNVLRGEEYTSLSTMGYASHAFSFPVTGENRGWACYYAASEVAFPRFGVR